MGGAPAGQQQLAASQSAYYNNLTAEQQHLFGELDPIIADMKSEFQPIFDRGPNQKGFSEEELQNLNAEATTTTGQSYRNVSEALNSKIAGEGGGNEFIPQGANKQLQAEVATSAAGQTSGELSQILQADYAQGYNEWLAAAQGLSSVGAVINPSTAMAGAATGAGSAASSTWSAIAAEDNSWMNLVGGALGAAGTALSGTNFGHK